MSELSELSELAGRPHRMPLRTPRVAEAVAAQLRLRILEGDLVDGAELPPEAQLLQEFPASRPSLREAIRILETEGLLTVRRGKVGGIVVRSPTAHSAAYHMGLLLHSRAIPLTDLATARNLLEPFCAEQAAMRDDHGAVGQRLRELNDEAAAVVADGPAFTGASVKFHEALVDAAGNQTLRMFAGMMESIWSVQERGWARRAADESSYPSVDLRRAVLRAHDSILKAIEAGDADLAGRVTRAHLKASQLYVASSEAPSVRVVDEYGMPRMDYDADRS
ncbi:FCD domain-containing protein [Dactylosporangium sp. NPDC005572]|uniref:FadR/GntR family transcriptional regulator n=1 Tax=Dactylosporangium sp. NPDC005572 TaxID=3156889 RepID=UPI0033AEE360